MTSSIKIVVFFGVLCAVSVSSKEKKLKNMPEKGRSALLSRTLLKIVSVP